MTEQIDIAGARASAQVSFDEMLEWELWSLRVWDDEEQHERRLEKLREIFERYLSEKMLQRDQGRYHSLDFQDPPEFEEKIASAEEAGMGKVWIYVPTGVVGGQARYLMTHEDDQWKICARRLIWATAGNGRKKLISDYHWSSEIDHCVLVVRLPSLLNAWFISCFFH